ncbi:Hypothetical predicted protein [Cloeon dipterum]|uniref:Uncharacterized protein n=1 Tax=Cloeon dipterum TaxID=197152 RepID=A0A8S1DNU6_9INSE|nr:Hypothetical predicted protein [Cloeon dipterum]CAB3388398.1 Hypothetical predicted protein [Cloeon dipterum]
MFAEPRGGQPPTAAPPVLVTQTNSALGKDVAIRQKNISINNGYVFVDCHDLYRTDTDDQPVSMAHNLLHWSTNTLSTEVSPSQLPSLLSSQLG